MGLGCPKIVVVSGGFDPIHIGHIRMLEAANKYKNIEEGCNYSEVNVFLNSDEWLMRKKGYVFMPWEERREIIKSLKCLTFGDVFPVDDSDGTVCKTLEIFKPDYFGNGGDRTDANTPEKEVCERLGIKMLWGLGGGKIQSSSELVKKLNV